MDDEARSAAAAPAGDRKLRAALGDNYPLVGACRVLAELRAHPAVERADHPDRHEWSEAERFV